MTIDDAVAGIAATITAQGLKCHPARDGRDYPEGVKVSDREIRHLEKHAVIRHGPHPDWNYTIVPAPAPGPGPEPAAGPDPALVAGLAALAGLPAPGSGQITLEWNADRTRQLTLDRGREPLRVAGNRGFTRLSEAALLAAAACHVRLRVPWALLGRLFGVHRSSISKPAAAAIPLLEKHGITRQAGGPRINTPGKLLEHAAAAGITLTIPGETPRQDRNDHPEESHDTPEITS